MKRLNLLAALLLMVAGLQTTWGQGFRVYQSDGTQFNFSLKTDSIVFDNGLGGDEVFGPFTPVNQCIVGSWQYLSSIYTFNADGTTDYTEGATYKFFPYQGNLVLFNASGVPVNYLRVLEVTADKMIVSTRDGSSIQVWGPGPQPQLVAGITLSATTLSLQPGTTKQLRVTVSPADATNKGVTWESSNEAVATVSASGLVTAVANGTCTITCRAKDGSGVYAQCQVTVGSSSGTPVTSITLSQTSLLLSVGTTQTLTATVLPSNATDKSVTWTSTDTGVATVSLAGTVSAVASGSCTVVCSAKDGSGVYAECQVNVTVGTPVTSITLNQTAIALTVGGSQTLTATVLPADATNKTLAWSSNDTSVASVNDSGKVTAHTRGTCTITCRATDGSGVKATCAVTVSVVTTGTTDGHEWVDLGLPSGTCWATCNVGANSPEEYGNYFAWGETKPKSDFSWSTYFDYNDDRTFNKYYVGCGLTEVLPEHDAATVNWSSSWQMPSVGQIQELCDSENTTTEWTTQNGVNGRLITSKSNGNSLFLPAAGVYNGTSCSAGTAGSYWSRSHDTDYSDRAYYIGFSSSGSFGWGSSFRYYGRCVRPVLKK